MMQSFQDEFNLPNGGHEPNTPAETGSILISGTLMNTKGVKLFRRGIGKLLHMMRWSRSDVMNRRRECSMFMSKSSEAHLKAMKRMMKFIVNTKEDGLTLNTKS